MSNPQQQYVASTNPTVSVVHPGANPGAVAYPYAYGAQSYVTAGQAVARPEVDQQVYGQEGYGGQGAMAGGTGPPGYPRPGYQSPPLPLGASATNYHPGENDVI